MVANVALSACLMSLTQLLMCASAGVLELMHFIKQENIKTLIDYVVEQHIDRSAKL